MQSKRILARLSLVATLALSGTALANTVVVTPLVSNGADAKKVGNIFSLMSSELEFLPGVDNVTEAEPASLNTDCVSNVGCLGGILSAQGGDALLTGVLTDQGGPLVLDFVYFSGGQIARRKAFNVTGDATQLANAMTDMLNEMVSGTTAQAQQAAAASPADFNANDEDDFFTNAPVAPAPTPAPAYNGGFNDGLVDAGPTPQELAQQAAAAQAQQRAEFEARQRAEAEGRQRAEAEARQRAEAEARQRAEAEARQRAEQDSRRRAEEQARLQAEMERKRVENERIRQQEEARRAEEARVQAAAAAQRQAAAPQPTASNINFANSADKITAEQIDAVIQFGAPSGTAAAQPTNAYAPTAYTPPAPAAYTPPAPAAYTPPAPAAYTPPAPAAYTPPAAPYTPPSNAYAAPASAYPPAPQAGYGQAQAGYGQQQQPGYGNTGVDAMEERELAAMDNPDMLLDLDGDDTKRKKNNKTGSGSTATLDRATPKTLQLTARGGVSKYYGFNFITGGLEVGVPLTKGLMVVGGFEAYNVQRELPPELQTPGQPIYTWNTIYPVNAGMVYKINTNSIFVPYVGADVIFVQYYKDEVGADWAAGARARAGIDLMIIENFGLNANLAIGGWSGKNWTLIEPTLGNAGLLPQFSAGAVVAF